MKQLICIFIILGLVSYSSAQIVSTKWLLSNKNVISFDENDNISVIDTSHNVPRQIEGTAMVTNKEGDVIFTATSTTIYDSLWAVINNGDDLLGSPNGSSIQSPIVLQKPGSPTEYYVFYHRGDEFLYIDQTLKYSIINICDETNEISIAEDEKDIVFSGMFSEKLELVEIDKDNYWLLASELSRKKLRAYKIDTSGINMIPVETWVDFALDGSIGAMKINNAKDKLAWSSYYHLDQPGVTIYDFDINTGKISTPEVVYIGQAYGIEWAPSDDYLYYNKSYNYSYFGIDSYNLSTGSINTLLYVPTYYSWGGLKLSPNKNKIFVSQHYNNKLGEIADIENGGVYSELDLDFLGEETIYSGLQERVINYGIEIPSEIILNWNLVINHGEDATVVSLPDEFTNVMWSDGQTGNSATFTEGGVYSVEAHYNCSKVKEEFEIEKHKLLVPDFNTTFINYRVDGNVATNDVVPENTIYSSSPKLISKPDGGFHSLTINSDGAYSFISNVVGTYIWEVPTCNQESIPECENVELVITVVDCLEPDLRPIANLDIATTDLDTDVEIFTLANDRCAVIGGCSLDPASVTIIANPSNGAVTVDGAAGNTTYSPNQGFRGQDTLRYQVCVDEEPGNCTQATQIIIISPYLNLNTTLAVDDYNTGGQDTPMIGDVSRNDTDPNNNNQIVTAQSKSNQAGTLTLLTDGTYTFIPNETFYGPTEFVYTICDDHSSQACANATLHLLVLRGIYVQVRVYLEGALINNGNEIGTTHSRPLMRDDLRESPYTGERYIPDSEPYDLLNVATHWETTDNPSLYVPFKRYDYDYMPIEAKFKNVLDPTSIFAEKGENSAVDWVSVELRDKGDYNLIVASRSGLVQRDGDVMDLNGELGLRFKGLEVDDYYIVVRHRNHLGAMTSNAKTPYQYSDIIDFTIDNTSCFDFGTTKGSIDYTGFAQKELTGSPISNMTGYKALWGGDFDGDGRVKFANPNDDLNNLFGNIFGYETDGSFNFSTNFDLAFGYQGGDFDMDGKSKFDSPNDDKNLLYGKLLFYPLNTDFNSNFNSFIEQVPEAFTLK